MTNNEYQILKLMKNNAGVSDLDINDFREQATMPNNVIGMTLTRLIKQGYVQTNKVKGRGSVYHLLNKGYLAVVNEERKRQ